MAASAAAAMAAAEQEILRKNPVPVFQVVVQTLRQNVGLRRFVVVFDARHDAGMNAERA